MEEIDIWRSAEQFMTLHGSEAALVVAGLADARMAEGNKAGVRVWLRVVKAINELSRTGPSGYELMN